MIKDIATMRASKLPFFMAAISMCILKSRELNRKESFGIQYVKQSKGMCGERYFTVKAWGLNEIPHT